MISVYKSNAIEALKRLADYSYQKQAWFSSNGPTVSSFAEQACNLFDDTGLWHALTEKQTVFGKAADNAIRELHAATDKVNEFRPPADIISDPLMEVVREKAAKALQLIQKSAVA